MALLLGIDTGGTFTDAVLLDDAEQRLVAKAKALTTKHDLAIGIGEALGRVMVEARCDGADVGLVSLSTTLATNALVERQGGRVALIAIGFAQRDLSKAGLADALGSDPVIILSGGHTTHGAEAAPLELAPLEARIDDLAEAVSGFAIAGYFAVRNPAHENTVKAFVSERTGMPVTCSHELSANLNGPKRALTTVLNARLVPMISRLIAATEQTMKDAVITAPLMVVRGDGALVSAEFATGRPVETILSGPAASLVGARYLTDAADAVVNDIGGTTSDVALLQDGRPKIDPDGARVGGLRTMVEAVAMHTFGLGGDSEIGLGGSALRPELTLGPRRLVPLSLLSDQFSVPVHAALDSQLKSALPNRNDGRFAWRTKLAVYGLSAGENRLFERLTEVPVALNELLDGHASAAALNSLVSRGLAQIAGLTPSDAMHELGKLDLWDKQAARKALELFGRRRDGGGQRYCSEPHELARRIVARVERRSAEIVLETMLAGDRRDHDLAYHSLLQDVLDRRAAGDTLSPMVELSLALDRPLIGLGASAHAYHPAAAKLLGTEALIPDHADVANAIGAVVGQVCVRASATVTQPAEGRFQVSEIETPFSSEEAALDAARDLVRAHAQTLASQAGATDYRIALDIDAKRAEVESRTLFVEALVTATATGRPAIAR